MITSDTMMPGKYYKVEYSSETYLCKAVRPDYVEVRWEIDHRNGRKEFKTNLDGTVWGCKSIIEITPSHYVNGEEAPVNNKDAKSLLEKEW